MTNFVIPLRKEVEAATTPEQLRDIKARIPKTNHTSPFYTDYLSLCGTLGIRLRYMTMTDEQKQTHFNRLSKGIARRKTNEKNAA
jgi:hypothetical protein